MASTSSLRVLFFDVFGTCVAQRGPVADELCKAAQKALESVDSDISNEVRDVAIEMTYNDWFQLGGEWNRAEDDFISGCKAKSDAVDWREVDRRRTAALPKLLESRGLVTMRKASDNSKIEVEEGSLCNAAQLEQLGTVWRHLTPWPDTCRGVNLFNQKFSTAALSNTYSELIEEVVSHAKIPFTSIFSADMFKSYKPNPKVYLSAADRMGVEPRECALIAAHLGDLKGAKACGFYTIYVERPLEEKAPELRGENIPDMWVKENENGFITVARNLGIQDEYLTTGS